jgi:hypothetical protein
MACTFDDQDPDFARLKRTGAICCGVSNHTFKLRAGSPAARFLSYCQEQPHSKRNEIKSPEEIFEKFCNLCDAGSRVCFALADPVLVKNEGAVPAEETAVNRSRTG